MKVSSGDLAELESTATKRESWPSLAVEAAPNAMVMIDRQRRIILVNRSAEQLFGYDRSELEGKVVDLLIPERFRALHAGHVEAFFERPTARGMGAGRDLFGLRADGSEVPIEIGLNPIAMPEGTFTLAAIIDITERRRAEAVHQQLAAVIDSSEDAIITKTLDGIVTSWNRGAERLFGYSATAAIGQSVLMVIPERLRNEESMLIARIRDGARVESFITRRRRHDGRELDVSVSLSPICSRSGTVMGAASIVRDITALKNSQQEAVEQARLARDRAEQLRRMLDEIVMLASRLGLNEVARATAPLLEETLYGPPSNAVFAAALLPFEEAFRGYVDANAKLALQNRQLAEAKVALEAANEELEAFSYTVAHDLRTPLNHIKGFSELLLDAGGSFTEQRRTEFLEHIQVGATKMNAMIADLLHLARVTRSELQRRPVNLSELAHAVANEVRLAHPSTSVKLVVQDGLLADCDAPLMQVVLTNLLGNAWKFSSKVKSACVEFGRTAEHAFFVRDNGVGFDAASVHKLFGVFQRLHAASEFEGTGIGLSIVKRVVQRHGGRVWAEGALGAGATFYFTLES